MLLGSQWVQIPCYAPGKEASDDNETRSIEKNRCRQIVLEN